MPINLQVALWGVVALLVIGMLIVGLKRLFRPSVADRELWLRIRLGG